MKTRILAALSGVAVVASAGTAIAAPTNDDIGDATLITSVPYTDVVSTQNATLESDEPRPCGHIASTVWYRFTPTFSGYVIAHTSGSDFDTALAVYAGSLFDPYPIDCSADALGQAGRVRFYVWPGGHFYLQAGGEFGEQGNLSFTLARPAELEGLVTDAVDDEPLGDICVDAFGLDRVLIGRGRTDRDGTYVLRYLPEGATKVRFSDCNDGAYATEWFSDKASFAKADPVALIAGEVTGAVDAILGIRPGPDLRVTSVLVEDVPLEVAGTEVPIPASYNKDVTVTVDNHGERAGAHVTVHAEVCPRSIGSCQNLGDKKIGRLDPGEHASVAFDWNALDTVGDVSLFVSVFGHRDVDSQDNVVESERYVWIGGTGFGARLCPLPGPAGNQGCLTD